MQTANPAAWAPLTPVEFIDGNSDAALSGVEMLGVFDPADKLVACQGCNVFPGSCNFGLGAEQSLLQVGGHLVDDAASQFLFGEHVLSIANIYMSGGA